MAVGILATVGLMPATSATSSSGAGTSAAGSAPAAAPRTSHCPWFPLPAAWFIGDPAAFYPTVHGAYNDPGAANVAYKITGQFPHSTTFSFSTYDNVMDLPGPDYALDDQQIVPDRGSVNPFLPGSRVMAKHRNYTAWAWPDSVPVPAGMKNVFLYPTKPVSPLDTLARWNLVMRMYHMQPGFRRLAAMRAQNITAVSTNTLRPAACPLRTPLTAIPAQVASVLRHFDYYGSTDIPPTPTNNKIAFLRYPIQMMLGPEGYATDGCTGYLMAQLPRDEISVVTVHKTPEYFNNNYVTPASIMKDYQVRYQSQTFAYFPEYGPISVNQNDGTYTPDGELVTVYLPGDPRLSPAQIRRVRAMAARLDYNVIQNPRNPESRPIAGLLPYAATIYRQKAISTSFRYGLNNVPCWTDPTNPATAGNDYRDFTNQTSPAFFRRFASSPRNMGPYWIDGEKMTFSQFVSQ